MTFKSFETSYKDRVWHELSRLAVKIVKKLRFTRNNQNFTFSTKK